MSVYSGLEEVGKSMPVEADLQVMDADHLE